MDIELLLQALMGLVAILAVLIFLLFLPSAGKKKEKSKVAEKKFKKVKPEKPLNINTDLKYLRDIIKKKQTEAPELQKTLDLIIKYHGDIHKKLGIRTHPDFDIYHDVLFIICRHPNANKDMIVKFDKELVTRNPNYKKDINEAITKGLNSRRV